MAKKKIAKRVEELCGLKPGSYDKICRVVKLVISDELKQSYLSKEPVFIDTNLLLLKEINGHIKYGIDPGIKNIVNKFNPSNSSLLEKQLEKTFNLKVTELTKTYL